MKEGSRFGYFGTVAIAFGAVACGGISGDANDPVDLAQEAIIGGVVAPTVGGDSVVLISGGCSGIALSDHSFVTVEHCLSLPPPFPGAQHASHVRLEIRSGNKGQRCATPGTGTACSEWDFAITRQPGNDLVILSSTQPLSLGVAKSALPLVPISANADSGSGIAHGYGLSSPGDISSVGSRLSASVSLKQVDDTNLYGTTLPGVRMCGGDSGGPLVAAEGTNSSPLLFGVLSASQYDVNDLNCTADGGLIRWSRVDAAFVKSALGCSETNGLVDCRGSSLPTAEARADARPGVREALRKANLEVIEPSSVTPAQIDAEGLVGTMTETGPVLVRPSGALKAMLSAGAKSATAIPTAALIAQHGGSDGTYIPLSPRGIALSGNGDQRTRLFVIEGGAVGSSSSTGAPGCEGTLIGSRVVRTAMHCVETVSRPWFTVRYDGGPTTWTFDGGATYVTFNPRQSDFYFYGGNYFNFGCTPGQATGQCISQDWALLIMAQDVWQPVHVIPTYMGYTTPTTGAVTNAGYPSCGDISSPNITSCQTGLMYGMNCSIVVNNTSYYYTNCDVSPGHSGSGTFKTSGGVRYLLGNHKGGPSNSGCSNGTCQAYDCGTDSWLYSFQNQQRTNYSAVTL